VADPGGRPPPIFGKVNLIFYNCIQCLTKIFLKLNLDFIMAEIRGVFGSEWCMRVCVIEIVAATVFCSAKAQFWIISEAILIPKIYARLQEIASNFSKISGRGPQTQRRCWRLQRSVRGFAPLPERTPFPKFLDPPLYATGHVQVTIILHDRVCVTPNVQTTCFKQVLQLVSF